MENRGAALNSPNITVVSPYNIRIESNSDSQACTKNIQVGISQPESAVCYELHLPTSLLSESSPFGSKLTGVQHTVIASPVKDQKEQLSAQIRASNSLPMCQLWNWKQLWAPRRVSSASDSLLLEWLFLCKIYFWSLPDSKHILQAFPGSPRQRQEQMANPDPTVSRREVSWLRPKRGTLLCTNRNEMASWPDCWEEQTRASVNILHKQLNS